MKSICLKSNNDEIINFLIKSLENIPEIVVSSNKFKIYKNVIIHYIGENDTNFLIKISEIISLLIETFYENKILEQIIDDNYFYFEDFEKEIILNFTNRIIALQEENLKYKKEILKKLVYEYFLNNKVMVIDGFVLFRTRPYLEILDYAIETAVTNYVISLRW